MAFRLAHFTDLHLTEAPGKIPLRLLLTKCFFGWVNLALMGRYSRLRDSARVTAALVADLERERPDHILFTGDMTGLSLEREFQQAHGLLSPLLGDGTISGIPGNHDLYTRTAVRRRLYEKYFGEWEASDWPDPPPAVRLLGDHLALICLKDSRPNAFYDSSGRVGKEQLERLSEILQDARLAGRRRIVALHYAPRRADGRPDSRYHGLRDAEMLLEVARAGRVDLLVHGHLHRRFVLPPGKGTPVAIANPGSLTYSAHQRAYHIYRVSAERIELEVRRYNETSGSFVAWPDAPGSGPLRG
jgi:3',5'-cyclic AMP phosphodiesterase CpdA